MVSERDYFSQLFKTRPRMVFIDPLITNIFFEVPIGLNTSTVFPSRNIKNSEIR